VDDYIHFYEESRPVKKAVAKKKVARKAAKKKAAKKR